MIERFISSSIVFRPVASKSIVGCLGAHLGSHLGAHLGSLFHATRERDGMEKSYHMKEGNRNRIRFRIRTPKQLWDWLPRFIVKELAPDTTEAEFWCQACGRRLRDLFGRAVKGMVDRTVLRALVNEICNEELYRNIPKPEIVEVRQPIPTQSDLLQGVLAQVLRSLNINLNFNPPQPQEPIQTVPVESLPVHTLSETCELYLKEKVGYTTYPP